MKTPLTEAQRAEIVRRYTCGEPAESIAKDFDRSIKPILRVVRDAGERVRSIGDYFRGLPWAPARRAATPEKKRGLTRAERAASRVGASGLSSHGYVRVNLGGRRRQYEHILIAERALGRPLQRDERVHHINCNPSDNRPENLLICTHAYHLALHARMRRHPYWATIKGT